MANVTGVLFLTFAAAALSGCSGAGQCTLDSQCDNALFCDGVERCAPEEPFASARGCVRAAPPCGPVASDCNEVTNVCQCETDADGDGVKSLACGGTDCNDADARVYPSASEVCDAFNLDEDCNERTNGELDRDSDGAIDARCCNGLYCGTDCDDSNPAVSLGSPEVCNGIDDNCNAVIDEGVSQSLYVDADFDGYGAVGANSQQGCPAVGFSPVATDCNDANPHLFPGSIRCTGTGNTPALYEQCSDAGVWVAGSCNAGNLNRVCTAQPAGFGICTPP